MSGSYEKINYSLRPAKSTERKMLCETFGRLRVFAPIESYTYIGMGSTYFSDFILFHRVLGISDMISIEKDEVCEERFRFNVPYGFVKVMFGISTDALAEIDLSERSIIWMDYDGNFKKYMLDDLSIILTKISSGSVFLITLNTSIDSTPGDDKKKRLVQFKQQFGSKVPIDIKEENLTRSNRTKVIKRMINNQIVEILTERNRPYGYSYYKYKQLFFFRYSDSGSPMITIGGIIFSQDEEKNVNECEFSALPFICEGDEYFDIAVPNLTFKEIQYLNSLLPCSNLEEIDNKSIPVDDIEKYKKIYRYYPNYMETYNM